jgi:N-acetylglucosaminyldiphosphoundecaprenol N-acetyl-beta-D-mannosaminyltransferase
METVNFAGIKVDNITLDDAVAKVEAFAASEKPKLIVTPNPEIIVSSQKDPELREIINNADLRIPDGISMVVVSKIKRKPLKERVTGIDLMLKIVEMSSKKRLKIFLLGGKPGIAQESAAKLIERFPGISIVGTYDGYFKDDQRVIGMIKDTRPDILFVGLGGGRQERWLDKYLNQLNIPVSMVIGGSMDVISERKKRAPKLFQKLYIEWLYRLLTEPTRWKRQLALPKFLWLTLLKR